MRNYITNICLVVGSLFWSTLVTSVNQFSSHANLPQVQTLHMQAGPVMPSIYGLHQICIAYIGTLVQYIALSSFSPHFLSPHTALTLDTSFLSSRLLSLPPISSPPHISSHLSSSYTVPAAVSISHHSACVPAHPALHLRLPGEAL